MEPPILLHTPLFYSIQITLQAIVKAYSYPEICTEIIIYQCHPLHYKKHLQSF